MNNVRNKANELVDKFFDIVLFPKKEKLALVLEGGAMRCIFTAGFLDAIQEIYFKKIDFIVGVSAGAACGASFAAGQRGRMQNIFINYLSDNRFLDYSRAFDTKKSILDLSYAIRDISVKHVPLDTAALASAKMKVFVGMTAVETAKAEFVMLDEENAIDAIIASCNIPFLSRTAISYKGKKYLDGGLVEPIPIAKAIELGATKIIAVLTQPIGYRETPRLFIKALLNKFFSSTPEVEHLIRHQHTIYNNSKIYVELFDTPGIELILITPPQTVKVELLTRNKELLLQSYAEGFMAANELTKKIHKFANFGEDKKEEIFF